MQPKSQVYMSSPRIELVLLRAHSVARLLWSLEQDPEQEEELELESEGKQRHFWMVSTGSSSRRLYQNN